MALSEKRAVRRRMTPLRWDVSPEPDAAERTSIKKLSGDLRISEVCARILIRRGHAAADSAEAFLSRRMDLLHDPMLLPDIGKAIARIAEAVDKGQRIMLFGDYDADGVTAAALMFRFFRVLKNHKHASFQIDVLVPERNQGYGLNPHALKLICEAKPNLLITLDNGISAIEPVEQLSQQGIDCIIVDHHHVGEKIPNAIAVINPKRQDGSSRYPFNELCGAGLAFKLAWALAVHFSQNKKVTSDFRTFLLDAMALAATGTLADVVPLVGENRVLAHHGLEALGRTRMPGLRALLETSRVSDAPQSGDVSFRVAPRINAAGRCGRAAEALELLITEDADRAAALAAILDEYNIERQGLESRILEDARLQALAMLAQSPQCWSFVLDSSDWHLGVIGIVASRIVEEFHRPALLLSIDKTTAIAQGSGRSIRALHLYEALAGTREHLRSFGGHAAAAGLTMDSANIGHFRAAFERSVRGLIKEDDLIPGLHIDERIGLDQTCPKLCADLDTFEPCGAGNHRPTLVAFGVSIPTLPKLMGKEERHLNFFARQNGAARRVVGFNCADRFNELCDLSQSGTVDIAFRPKLNTYRGETSVELVMDAFRRSV